MQLPIGWCADRFNFRWLYAGAFTIWSFAQGLTGLASSFAAIAGLSLSSWHRRIHLPAGRYKDRQFAVRDEKAWSSVRALRFRDPDGAGSRRHTGSLPFGSFWMAIGASLVGLATGNLLTILQSCAPPEAVGIWTGAENFAGNLAGIIAPLAVALN